MQMTLALLAALANSLIQIKKVSKQCDDLNILLNPSKTQEMMFSTQRAKPHAPTLVLNGTNIVLSDKVKYISVLVNQNLRFHEHVQSVVTTVSRRMYIVKNLVYLSSKPLANMLFKSFIMSRIAYCLSIIFTCIYASDEKAIQKIFKDCSKLGIEHLNIDLHIQKLTKEPAIKYILVDNDHFINNFLSQCPSGRY